MKKFKSLLLAFASIIVILSCSNDDDGSADNAIVGTWGISEINFNSRENGAVVANETFSTDVCNAPLIFTFGTDGDFSLSNVELEFDVDVDNNPFLFCQINSGVLSGNWVRNSGINYVLTIDNDPAQAEIIVSNNNTTIEIRIIEEDFDDVDDITFTDTITFRGNLN
jgi:hypothetical protein